VAYGISLATTLTGGDLMPGNVPVADGRLTAVIDFATARAADPAGDLLAACYLFDCAYDKPSATR
jgi:aminoglycoside phosphotransferase (APT) family kinase protein